MGALLIGLVLLLLALLLDWPSPIEPLLLIIGVVLLVYGVYLVGSSRGWRL